MRSARHPFWTAADDECVRMLLAVEPMTSIAARLGRTEWAVFRRAHKLGMAVGCPRGREFLKAAARRTGYDLVTLRRILKRARVELRDAGTVPGKARKFPRKTVDPLEVDEAVAGYLKTETLTAAMLCRGLRRRDLIRRLVGVPGVPAKPSCKRAWRIPTVVIDRALAVSP